MTTKNGSIFKPMLAATPDDLSKIVFPVMVSPKLDGVRCLAIGGKMMSRSMKPIPNKHVQECFAGLPDGFDGELILGDAWDDPYRRTVSAVMSEDGKPAVSFCAFDLYDLHCGFQNRYEVLEFLISNLSHSRIVLVQHQIVTDLEALQNIEEVTVKNGYEGIMVRSVDGPYKQGRSTVKEGFLLKIKRFVDSDAVIYDFEERMHNANEAKTNALGHTERSSRKENLVARGDLGALLVRDVKTEVEFKIGTGFDDALRAEIWLHRRKYAGKIVRYKYFPTGAKDKPRFPVFQGFRDARDMDAAV